MVAALATNHGRGQPVCAITLDETPSGVIKMHTRADAPPSSPVVNDFEARWAVDYVQEKAAIRACHRLGRRSFSSTHERNRHERIVRRPRHRPAKLIHATSLQGFTIGGKPD